MQSLSICSLSNSGLPTSSFVAFNCKNVKRCSLFDRKLIQSRVRWLGFRALRRVLRVRAMDDDFGDVSIVNDSDNDMPSESYVTDTSDREASLQPVADADTPEDQLLQSDDSTRTTYEFLNNVILVSFSTLLLLLVDNSAWRIARLPLPLFYLMRPFLISAISVFCAGNICVPLFHSLKLQFTVQEEVPTEHSSKKKPPTIGGLYFVPIGVLVAEAALSFSSAKVSAVAATTVAFAAIGLLDDLLSIINNRKYGLSGWFRISLEIALGLWVIHWSYTKSISTLQNLKMGKFYPLLSSLFFLSLPNGINMTDGFGGLAAGIAASVFIVMTIAVLPICSELSVFGASMAGACIGFLFQNHRQASIFMGGTGALALGGALTAMASCTGMFFPLFIASGVFVLEAFSAALQLVFVKVTEYLQGRDQQWFKMASLHRHLELCGIKEPTIVAASYVVTCVLTLCAAYVGLTSARFG